LGSGHQNTRPYGRLAWWAGTATHRIDHPCQGRDWGRRYYAGRHNLRRLAAIDQSLLAPIPLMAGGPRTWAHGHCRSCPARLDPPNTARGAFLLSCGDLEANPGPPPRDCGEGDNAVVPDWVVEACGRLGIYPFKDAFATITNHRLPSFWTREYDASASRWTPRPWHTAEMPRPPDLLIHTDILPYWFTRPSYLIPLCPFSLDLMHCQGRWTARENRRGRCPPYRLLPAESVGWPVPLPTPGTHQHGARVPYFAPGLSYLSNTPPWAMEGPCPCP